MNKNVERGQATRAQLIDVATRLFAAHGYDGTSIEAVLADSGVSRGSLYHHFPGKEALFLAVMEEIGLRAAQPVLDAMNDALDPVAALRLGCLGWIRLAVDPVVQQIMLIDAPAVLGWERWRELDEQTTLGFIRAALAYAADTGRIERHARGHLRAHRAGRRQRGVPDDRARGRSGRGAAVRRARVRRLPGPPARPGQLTRGRTGPGPPPSGQDPRNDGVPGDEFRGARSSTRSGPVRPAELVVLRRSRPCPSSRR